MMLLAQKVCRFWASEDGPTAVEYAVILALIVVVSLSSIKIIGTQSNKSFKAVGKALKVAKK